MKNQPAVLLAFGPHLPSVHAVIKVVWTEDGKSFYETGKLFIHPKLFKTLEALYGVVNTLLSTATMQATNQGFATKLYELHHTHNAKWWWNHRGEWVPVK